MIIAKSAWALLLGLLLTATLTTEVSAVTPVKSVVSSGNSGGLHYHPLFLVLLLVVLIVLGAVVWAYVKAGGALSQQQQNQVNNYSNPDGN